MTFVVPTKKDGLFCFDCGEFISNTANHEMKREGVFAYSHSCPKNEFVRNKIKQILKQQEL